MDRAEAWLRENDPDYAESSRDWANIKTGNYIKPAKEVPTGNADDVQEQVVGEPKRGKRAAGVWVRPVGKRICGVCHELFTPLVPWQTFCSEAHKKKAKRERHAR